MISGCIVLQNVYNWHKTFNSLTFISEKSTLIVENNINILNKSSRYKVSHCKVIRIPTTQPGKRIASMKVYLLVPLIYMNNIPDLTLTQVLFYF